MTQYAKVSNAEGLVRDMATGAIINNNVGEYERYMIQRASIKKQRYQLATQSEDIDKLKQNIEEIKKLLHILLSKNGIEI